MQDQFRSQDSEFCPQRIFRNIVCGACAGFLPVEMMAASTCDQRSQTIKGLINSISRGLIPTLQRCCGILWSQATLDVLPVEYRFEIFKLLASVTECPLTCCYWSFYPWLAGSPMLFFPGI